jgi:hypothetical protein
VNGSSDSVDSTFPIGIKSDANIEVGNEVKRRNAVEYVSAFQAIDAAKSDVAFRYRQHSLARGEIRLDGDDLLGEPQFRNRFC